ncbi:heterokaryon incompatibility protein [Colletotrichum truncatum]|uniref:Heterokaryon incompatibility protein n=1 Tax=Colletotrichum truncatum TaxID=5467 RepID=A0ACC3YLC4_COLTU|nr:heterokaryon incompatibility protein [Colletotrichum truncatum]KAF6781966.1 heterokaryon incompatibility protein [Colletotrichum truncatum]
MAAAAVTITRIDNRISSIPASASRSSYQYTPLERDQIRLVVLVPGHGSDPITVRILICHRRDAPPYEAVSYTWGDDAALKQNIEVLPPVLTRGNTTLLSVPQSCASVLRTLRSSSVPRILWMDALSINQSNLHERSLQVRIMPKIYRTASKVVICLSKTSSEDHTEAVEFIARGRFKNAPPATLAAVNALFKHPWFSRTWVIQEVAKARNAIVLYNDTYTPWSNFSLCAKMLSLDVPVASPIRRLRQRGFIDTITTDQFVKAICEATACDCRDPRDRVFAFLSMYPTMMSKAEIEQYRSSGYSGRAGERGEESRRKGDAIERESGVRTVRGADENGKAPQRITNYAYSVETVYTQFAALLLKNQGLDFLSAVQGRSTSHSLPSWVPDWRAKGSRTILAHLPLTEFNAGGHWENQVFRILPATDDSLTERLEVSAIRVGEISKLGDTCDVNVPGWEDIVFRQWRSLAEGAWKAGNPKDCSTKALSDFVQTIMTDSDNEFVDTQRSICQRLSGPKSKQQETKTLLAGLDDEAVTKLRISCHGRRLFVAANGAMGLVASESEERDFVAVLPGARLPYSFRHRYDLASTEVELVGECFIQGMMRGEALAGSSSFLRNEIRIC